MKKSYLFIYFLSVIAASLIYSSCTRDKLVDGEQNCAVEITYEDGARSVLNNTCAYSGCHDGFNSPGDFRTYAAMSSYLNETDFEQRVINLRDMPPVYASGPTTLTAEEIQILQCWIENEYKEN